MRCTVLLFAHLREAIGEDRLEIDLPDGSTVEDALNELSSQHESILQFKDKLAVAIDQKYQPKSSELHDGATIALIPPVSGG